MNSDVTAIRIFVGQMAFVIPAITLHRECLTGKKCGIRGSTRARSLRTVGAKTLRASAEGSASAAVSSNESLEKAWTQHSERMQSTGESPSVAEWNKLFDIARETGCSAAQAIWILERMQVSGRKATAATYEILLEVCLSQGDRAAAFLLVEKMWSDKVLLGDVSLPEDMERTLRAILPPEAFD